MANRDNDPGPTRERLAALYDRHAAGLYRYALMILADPAAAQDAVQQVFVALLDRPWESISAETDFLRTCVRNACFTALRRRRRDHGQGFRPSLIEAAVPSANEDERIALEEALRAVPSEQREVVHLKVYEGMTFEEIGTRTGVPANTAASRYRYALATLRRCLAVPPRQRRRHG